MPTRDRDHGDFRIARADRPNQAEQFLADAVRFHVNALEDCDVDAIEADPRPSVPALPSACVAGVSGRVKFWACRSGFGVFVGRDEVIGITRRLNSNPPYVSSATLTGDQKDSGFLLVNGLPSYALLATRGTTDDNSFPFDFP